MRRTKPAGTGRMAARGEWLAPDHWLLSSSLAGMILMAALVAWQANTAWLHRTLGWQFRDGCYETSTHFMAVASRWS